MNEFLKRALQIELSKNPSEEQISLLKLAEKAVEFGFLSESSLVSDDEFLAFEKQTGADRDDVRAVVHGLERLNNADVYSSKPSFF